jgi:hypothetical protein
MTLTQVGGHILESLMRTNHQSKLAQADSRIAAAERNIKHVQALLPRLTAQGVSTREIEGHLGLMTEALHHLKEQRRLIAGAWH